MQVPFDFAQGRLLTTHPTLATLAMTDTTERRHLGRGSCSCRLIGEADAADADELGEVGTIVGRVCGGVDMRLGLERGER